MTQRIPKRYLPDDSKLTGNAQLPETIQSDLHCLSHEADARQMKFSEFKYSVLHIGKVNPKSNYTMGNSPLQVLKRKESWEWLFQLVIPLLEGTNSRNDWKSKTNDVLDHYESCI